MDILTRFVKESASLRHYVRPLIWRWLIAGKPEVDDLDQWALLKISCPGGGDPYWFTANDIPDDDKWAGNTQSMLSMENHLANPQKVNASL